MNKHIKALIEAPFISSEAKEAINTLITKATENNPSLQDKSLKSISVLFQDDKKGVVRMIFGSNFKTWFYESSANKIILPDLCKGMTDKLNKYRLSRNMNDTEIRQHNNSIPLDLDTFWKILIDMLINNNSSENDLYIIHAKDAYGVDRSFRLLWHTGERAWFLVAYPFNFWRSWSEGNIFLWL